MYSDYLSQNNEKANLPNNPKNGKKAFILFVVIFALVALVAGFREQIGLTNALSDIPDTSREIRYIEKNGDRIALVGVENWGAGRFKKAGDLEKSISKIEPNDFKILLSHDPSHWEAEVIPHAYPFHLTLSGHTHGFQFGIEIPGWIKWSPIQWRYKQWAGIYENKEQKLNVNRGFGYLAYPGRVGIWPEITVITLKKKKLLV